MSVEVNDLHVPVLVAGVGNVFFGDDGFGPEVAQVLAREPVPGTKVEDFGIRGLHLAYELLNGYERAIIIDAVPRGDVPGTLYVIEPDALVLPATPDAHSMDLGNVFAYLRTLGGQPPPLTIVGCEPESIEPGMGLSPVVARSVDGAAALVRRLLTDHPTQYPQGRVPTTGRFDMVKAVVRSSVAVAFAVFAARQIVYGGRDLARYNKMREMSGDPPLGMSKDTATTNAQARTSNPLVMLMSIPSDVQRYLKLKSM